MRRLTLMALALAFAATASAQKRGTGNQAFDELDKNHDGTLSSQEAAGNKEIAKRFARFDANKDGRLDLDEYLKAGQDNDARVLADSAITVKVKAALLAEKGVPSTAISVETYESRVLLSGFVDSAAVKGKAGKVAAGVQGVKRVQNNLVVK